MPKSKATIRQRPHEITLRRAIQDVLRLEAEVKTLSYKLSQAQSALKQRRRELRRMSGRAAV